MFQQSGISIPWYCMHKMYWIWMDLTDLCAFRWASLHGKAGLSWHSTKSVVCEGGRTRFSCKFVMDGEDLQSGKDREGLCCTPVREVWRTDPLRRTSEGFNPGKSRYCSVAFRGCYEAQELLLWWILRGKELKQVSGLKISKTWPNYSFSIDGEMRCCQLLVIRFDPVLYCVVHWNASTSSGLFGLHQNRWSGRQLMKWEWCISRRSWHLETRQPCICYNLGG